jgi:hypothetical protein
MEGRNEGRQTCREREGGDKQTERERKQQTEKAKITWKASYAALRPPITFHDHGSFSPSWPKWPKVISAAISWVNGSPRKCVIGAGSGSAGIAA